MIDPGPRAKSLVCFLTLIVLGVAVVCWQGARAERAFSDGPVSDAAQVISATSGKIAFSSDRIAGILKIFTMNPDGTGITCLMCNGATDPSGTGSTDPRVGRAPAFSPDGNTIAFVRTDLGEIWLMNSDGTNPRTLTTGSSPAWSPDGARIAFTRSVNTTTPAHNEIFVINADGSGLGNITNGPDSDILPSWGAALPAFPQGRIAFRSLRNSNSEIYVIAPTSMAETFLSSPKLNVTNNPAFDSSPEWSPDGRKLAFYSDRDQGTGGEDIYTMEMNPSPGLVTRLTTSPNSDSFPAWSPDGAKIAYTSFPGGNLLSEVFLIDSVTGAAIPPGNITNSPSVDFDLTWGTPRTNAKVVFQKGPNSTSDIYLITPGSGISTGLRKGYHPAFSPDGTKIAFVDNTPGSTNGTIMLMDANGMNQRSLAHPTQGFSPTWAPDGLRLAFVRGDFDSVGNDGKGALYVIDMTPNNEGDHETLIPGTLQVSRPSWGSNNRIVYACLQPHPGGGNDVLGIRVTEPIPASAQIAATPPAITAISGANLNDRDPAWSADGTAIAFLSTRDYPSFTASEIYVMDAQGNNVRRVTNSNLFKSGPAWSPDGTKIVFYGGGNLRLVNSDGSNGSSPTFVTSFGSGDAYPNWGLVALAASSASPSPSPSPVVNLEITKSGPTAPVNEDDEFIYNITVKNSNNSTGVATGVKVVDPLPNGVRFKRSSNQTCVDSQDIVTCNLPDIAVSDSRSVSLIVSAGAGIRNNQASVTANQHLQPVLSNIVKTTVKYDNDNFAKARQISGNSGDSFSSNVGATKEVLSMPCVDMKGFATSPCEPNHAKRSGHQSVWWKWSPSRSGTVYFNTNGSSLDTTLAAYAIYGGKLSERASNDDYGAVTSRISFKANEGDQYYIAVDGYQDSAGDIFLQWSQNPEIKPSPLQAKINVLDPGFAKLKEVTTGSYNVRIIGTGFNELSQVYVNGLVSDSRRANRSVTSTEINVQLPASDIAKIGPVQIVVCGGSDSGGGCANSVSNIKILNVIGYSTFEVAPGQITEVCKLDDAGHSLGMCFKTSGTTCPGPSNCQITASLYEAITVADLKARSVGTKFHNIGMGVNNDIEVKIEIDEAPPALSVPVGSVNLNGLLLPPAPGLTTNAGLGLLDYGSTKFTAAQFANSLKLVGQDGGTLIGSSGSTLVGQDGGTIYSRATGSFNYNNALSFITRLISNDGSTFSARQLAPLIGNDGATLISNDGSTLIGNDGGTLVGLDGGSLIRASSFLGLKASFAAQSMGIQAGNLVNPNTLLANLHGVGFVSHNGGDILVNNGSNLIARDRLGDFQSLTLNLGDRTSAPAFDPNYKGWFVISGSGGSLPAITQTTDSDGNAGGAVSVKFDNTSFPKISDLANTVLTVAADPSIVQFSSSGFTATEGVVSANITVSRTGDISLPLNVRYSTADGTAQQRTDYKATSGALKFAPGETSKTIVVPIVDDVYSETAETISISLRNADEGVVGTRHTATLTINDNDSGTPTVNPLDTPSFFVRQHYYDVFDRLPDQPGLDSRIAQINQCGTDVACLNSKRITVSLAFLTDAEFQETGFFIARVFKALLGRQPTFNEFLTDRAKVIAGADPNVTKTDFLNEFIYRQMLIDPQLADLTPEQFVDRLNANSGGALTSARRTALVNDLKGQSASMATVLAEVSDNAVFKQNEYNAAFVTMLYFTLLRRDTDSVYASRLQALNQNNNYPGLVDSFVNSSEYRTRFGISAPSWEVVALTGSQAEIKTWTSGGRTYAYLKLSFPNAGYRVVNWGQASQSGNNFTGDALIETFSGVSVQAVTTTAGMYDLGVLAPGSYSFIFKNNGVTVKTQAFTVAAPPFPANPIDDARQFVKQQYRDFLNREADQAGEDFWTDNILKCNDPARRPAGQTVEQCTLRQRETTSGAFFQSPEFQYTGYYVLRMYRGALGRQPKLSEFIPDALFVGNGIVVGDQLSAAKINQNRADFAAQFVNCTDGAKYRCAEFKAIYDGLSNQQYVDQLFQTTGVNASAADRAALVNGLNANPATETRATVLQKVVDGTVVVGEGNQQFTTSYGQAFYNSEFTRAFVQLEYFGYMKRDPDDAGYAFWLGKLNSFGGNFVNAEMVLAFISSPEYRSRFGQP